MRLRYNCPVFTSQKPLPGQWIALHPIGTLRADRKMIIVYTEDGKKSLFSLSFIFSSNFGVFHWFSIFSLDKRAYVITLCMRVCLCFSVCPSCNNS